MDEHAQHREEREQRQDKTGESHHLLKRSGEDEQQTDGGLYGHGHGRRAPSATVRQEAEQRIILTHHLRNARPDENHRADRRNK